MPSDAFSDSANSVAKAELSTLKPTAQVYEKRSGLFFLTTAQEAIRHIDEAAAPEPAPAAAKKK